MSIELSASGSVECSVEIFIKSFKDSMEDYSMENYILWKIILWKVLFYGKFYSMEVTSERNMNITTV